MTWNHDESMKLCTRLGQLVLGVVSWHTAHLEGDDLNEVAIAHELQKMDFMHYCHEMGNEDFGQMWSDLVSDVTHEMREARK
jgi:hypothetical protein